MESELCAAITLRAQKIEDSNERYFYLRSRLDTCIQGVSCPEFNATYSFCCYLDDNQDNNLDIQNVDDSDLLDHEKVEFEMIHDKVLAHMETHKFHSCYVQLFELFVTTLVQNEI